MPKITEINMLNLQKNMHKNWHVKCAKRVHAKIGTLNLQKEAVSEFSALANVRCKSYNNHVACAEHLVCMSVHLFLWTRTKSANFATAFFCKFEVPIFACIFFAHLNVPILVCIFSMLLLCRFSACQFCDTQNCMRKDKNNSHKN